MALLTVFLITTPLVINEVNRHLTKLKLKPKQLEELLDRQIIRLVVNPPESLQFLLSLDQKHLVTRVLTPKQFWQRL